MDDDSHKSSPLLSFGDSVAQECAKCGLTVMNNPTHDEMMIIGANRCQNFCCYRLYRDTRMRELISRLTKYATTPNYYEFPSRQTKVQI